MSNAFAPILRARPNPIFGRPVHQGSPPFDYSPILLLKPFGFRITPGHPVLQRVNPLANEALPPPLDTAPLIRAPEGL